MNTIREAYKKLHDPFPYTRGFLIEMMAALRLCIVIAFLFYWVEPFGIQCASTKHLIIYGMVAFLSALVNWSIAHFLVVQFINTEKWTIFKDILRSLLFIIVNALFLLWYAQTLGNKFDSYLAFKFVFYTFLIAIIPLFYRNLSINNMLLKKRLKEAEKLNLLIDDKKELDVDTRAPILIKSNIVNELLETNNEELLYIKAEKNYINVFLNENGKIKQMLLRISLINTKKQLNDPFIVQCHRSYLVNLRHVINVSGNAQELRLVLNQAASRIPVSRTYKKAVMEKMTDFKSSPKH